MKDNFSTQSDQYAKYRPSYPKEIFEYIAELVPARQNAWDCGTGNGQAASYVAGYFENVFASDISAEQLKNAVRKPNIHYSVQAAERTGFPDNYFDLVLIAQAIHWFDFKKFYAEVKRTGVNGGIIMVLGYGLASVSPAVDKIIHRFYFDIVGPYWDKERKYVDENYQTIPFPFEEIKTPLFRNTYQWPLEHFAGYLNTWSAVKHFIKDKAFNPVDIIFEELKAAWEGQNDRDVNFPALMRTGIIKQ
jgi:hypothetical protein